MRSYRGTLLQQPCFEVPQRHGGLGGPKQATEIVDRHSEVQVLGALNLALQNADNLPTAVDERSSTISGICFGVRLDHLEAATEGRRAPRSRYLR